MTTIEEILTEQAEQGKRWKKREMKSPFPKEIGAYPCWATQINYDIWEYAKKPAAAEAAAAATFNVDVGLDADADADAAVLLLEGDRERRRASLFDFFFFVVSRLPAEVEGGGG